ncbi:MAG: hypothetical protein A2268_03435 [Candidatus Raymondbacteria bacterium RifOxyA12_full_50_37]|uniref:GlcNAc-PI de-N-acetylase n=1 Tax=Candidatus Raymondbacteria bacterium RIFOXYD12_FULL_49_13 TaxID=1817890 RepID=A0A1F7F3U3_UNCRA|nr:MAG: hypothetical protein A2268_03435 [Candidatus Raymondbacteria bacterium RifOxyA12_full_50_37]OGJ88402.1 MAG: hypothetical protein A2248_00975 [Candidatus Raymondbacteria bacterium RIFOXYA2_FULL_49_16]OGJ96240.1 MAG: hypothetical protein A2453_08705 [Candidatus Raymondbacteria bacterium RIFOXYC2_FULL_50_21]OGK00578.1 MAG: hypothetical protein A2350_21650 [Candidatus Raymondbacteria bacterium RifOxyB12_full_50_8]OGK01232.1 MAG: hypothetical protein A2519_22520 [Candidatus Raymondbacteria b
MVGEERRAGTTLASVSRHWQGDKERFLFVSPHDDDVVLGAGLLMQLAVSEGVPVHIVIVTNGSMGYCSKGEKTSISAARRNETYNCYTSLGIPKENIHWANFPDGSLNIHAGRRFAVQSDLPECVIAGATGIQNSFTHFIRRIRPTQCFLPTFNDLHPDHKITYQELMISLFHASGTIWPELGDPIAKVPHIHEMAVYCDFPAAPRLKVASADSYFEKKLAAVLMFESQKQIASLVESIRTTGAVEFFRNVEFNLYNPFKYHQMFDERFHVHSLK